MLSLQVAIISDPGGRKYNEDACGHWRSETRFCCVLADGAGGHGGGDIASRLAVTSVLTGFSEMATLDGDELLSLVRSANHAILDAKEPGSVKQDMHTTVVCLAIDTQTGRADWAHSGDSRLYWFRNSDIVERTRDHSYVQSMVDAGLLQEAETRNHPKRSVLNSALGRPADDLEATVTQPSRSVAAGDVFLLCSDGVWEHLADDVLEQSLSNAPTPKQWLEAIKGLVKDATSGLASHDNFTAIAVWVGQEPDV